MGIDANPIVGSFGCCARAASGHAAATPPSSVMKNVSIWKHSFAIAVCRGAGQSKANGIGADRHRRDVGLT
jgi:hypothetical protein